MKKLSVRVGEYQGQDGSTKGRYVNIGVVMQKPDGKEYILLDPTTSVAGLMALQNAEAIKKNEPLRDRVMVGIFEEESQQQSHGQPQQGQQGGYQQAQQGQQYGQQQAQQGGYNPPPQGQRR